MGDSVPRDCPLPDHSTSRLAGLDGLRGFAACVVAFGYHPQFIFAQDALGSNGGGYVVRWLHGFGWTAVDLFFVLSGYVFAHVYLRGDALGAPSGARKFWIARFARLYPLHLAMLVLTACLFRNHDAHAGLGFLANLLLLQIFHVPVAQSFNGPSWSISVEFVCYAIFASAASASRRAMQLVTFLMIGIGAFGVAISGDLSVHSVVGNLSRGFLGFFVGQLLWRERSALALVPGQWLAGGLLAGLAIATAIGPDGPGMLLALTCLAWPCAILMALREGVFAQPMLLWLGDRSYAIYMTNVPIIMGIANAIGVATDVTGALVRQLVLIGVSLVVADVVYSRFELPMRSWCHARLLGKSQTRTVSPVT